MLVCFATRFSNLFGVEGKRMKARRQGGVVGLFSTPLSTARHPSRHSAAPHTPELQQHCIAADTQAKALQQCIPFISVAQATCTVHARRPSRMHAHEHRQHGIICMRVAQCAYPACWPGVTSPSCQQLLPDPSRMFPRFGRFGASSAEWLCPWVRK